MGVQKPTAKTRTLLSTKITVHVFSIPSAREENYLNMEERLGERKQGDKERETEAERCEVFPHL